MDTQNFIKIPIITAVLIDGGFYQKRANKLFGYKSPSARIKEILEYVDRHLFASEASLYRIYYYDCPPSQRVLYHPLTKRQVNLRDTDQYRWMTDFMAEFATKRKVALRRGEELETQRGYILKPQIVKKLCNKSITVDELKEIDFDPGITQKGVDMRIGLDIASLSERGIVNQIIMISGDSDFVPAAKYARRAGIDFIIDPMLARVASALVEHSDGIRTFADST